MSNPDGQVHMMYICELTRDTRLCTISMCNCHCAHLEGNFSLELESTPVVMWHRLKGEPGEDLLLYVVIELFNCWVLAYTADFISTHNIWACEVDEVGQLNFPGTFVSGP